MVIRKSRTRHVLYVNCYFMFIVYYHRVGVSVWWLVPEGIASPVHHDHMTDNNNGNKKEPDTSCSIRISIFMF